MTGLSFGLVFAFASMVAGWSGPVPDKCCSPETFEAEIKATSYSGRGQPEDDKRIIDLVYDYKKTRWALNITVPRNQSENAKIIMDHKEGKQYMIKPDGCMVAPLVGNMTPHCIQENASYYGEYSYGRDNNKLTYDVWGYQFTQAPLQFMSKVTKKHCMPLQDDIFGVTQTKFRGITSRPPCIPWDEPEKVLDGSCYKCFSPKQLIKKATHVTRHVTHIQYNNLFRGMHRVAHFDIPEDCKEVEIWDPEEINLNHVQKYFVLRLKDA